MTVRLHTLLRASLDLSRGTDPKARANGYSHSYLDPETAQLGSLAAFPTDDEIKVTADQAWDEAVSLLSLLGIEYDDIKVQRSGPQKPNIPTSGISEESNNVHDHQDDSEVGAGDQNESTATQLARLIGVQNTQDWGLVNEESQNKLHVLTCAAMALDISDMERL